MNNAAKKKEVQKFLRYVTKRDGRVRKEHLILDWVVKKVEDPFWKIYTPPNGWWCRCTLEKLQSDVITSTNTIGLNLHKSVPNIWRFNSAMEKQVFSPKHPYFKVAKQHKAMAKKNFNMPKPKIKKSKKK